MPGPGFEFKAPNQLLSAEFIERPRLRDLARLEITPSVPNEYEASLHLTDHEEPLSGVIDVESNQVSILYPVTYRSRPKALLVGVFCLEMHLRGVALLTQNLNEDLEEAHNEVAIHETVLGEGLYDLWQPNQQEMQVLVKLQSPGVVQGLTIAVSKIVDIWDRP